MKSKLSPYSDAELIQLVQKGTKQDESLAFNELYNRYDSMVLSYCKVVLVDNDAANDIFQETFIRFYKSIKEMKDFPNIPGFLITIARNLCLNFKRDKKVKVSIDEFDIAEKNGFNYDNKEMIELIVMSLEFIDEKYRNAFMLREFDGLSFQEIADQEETSVSNIKIRLTRAKKMIIKVLDPYIKDLSKNL